MAMAIAVVLQTSLFFLLLWQAQCQTLDKIAIVRYTVQHMVQIINISQARANLAKLVNQVRETKRPVVIVQDSIPSVVLQPYEEKPITEEHLKKLLSLDTSWFTEKEYKEYKKTRKEAEKAVRRHLNE